MGKGDRGSKRGKIWRGTTGKRRLKKKKSQKQLNQKKRKAFNLN